MKWIKDPTNGLIVLVLAVIFFLWALSSTFALRNAQSRLEDALLVKMTMEERYVGSVKTNSELERKLSFLKDQLAKQYSELEGNRSELAQERIVVKALKEELQRQFKAKAPETFEAPPVLEESPAF